MKVDVLFMVEHCLVGQWHVHLGIDGNVNGHKAFHKALSDVRDGHMDQAINGHRHRHRHWHLDGHGHRAIHNHWFFHTDRRIRVPWHKHNRWGGVRTGRASQGRGDHVGCGSLLGWACEGPHGTLQDSTGSVRTVSVRRFARSLSVRVHNGPQTL